MSPRPALVAAIVAALAWAGCDQTEVDDPVAQVRGSVAVLVEGCADRAPLRVLATLTESQQKLFVDAGDVLAGCERVLTGLTEGAETPSGLIERFERAEVSSVELSAGFATATIVSEGRSAEVELGDAGSGEWRLANPDPPD